MIRRYSVYAIMTLIVVGAFVPSLSQAAGLFPGAIVPDKCAGADAATACDLCQLGQLARNVTNFAIFFAVIMAAVLFSWSGIQYLTNRSNPSQVSKAKQTLTNVFLGLLIVLCAWLVINTLMSFMMANDGDWRPWNQICANA